ncbi:hypothetical protein [Rufibacter latericius]|uniref:hypothetical protein n=1 Tax=Rufibacter latericius TaxID=2487040 RepID=UPI000F62A025|nr:hypothetical protein [Rufibacter latericius]
MLNTPGHGLPSVSGHARKRERLAVMEECLRVLVSIGLKIQVNEIEEGVFGNKAPAHAVKGTRLYRERGKITVFGETLKIALY